MQKSSSENVACTTIKGATQANKVPSKLLRGRVIGEYMNTNIFDQLIDNHGQVWIYSGVTQKASDCKPGVIVLKPGIVYTIAEPGPTATSGNTKV